MRRYEDFDLAIERADEDGYRVKVLNSPAGQADGEFTLPFGDMELENFLLKIGRHRGSVRRLESPETEAARNFGSRLFDSVFADEIGTQWRRSLDAVEREELGLRIRLRLNDVPELNDIPWEFLHSKATDRFVVLSSWTPLVRYISLDRGAEALTVAPPLRILAMVSSPTDYPPLDVEAEWRRLDDSLGDMVESGLVEITRLEEPTLRALQRELRRGGDYHIFHFIGHGGFDERADDGVLLLENEMGRAREVSGHDLGTILLDARTIRLAVLNSCEGARTSSKDPLAGAAQSLVFAGVDAVVAMQFEISDQAAIVFAHEFYAALADGFPVDAAMAEARRAIFGASADVEWGTPVLHMRSEDGRLFEVVGEPAPPTITKVEIVDPVAEVEETPAPSVADESPGDDLAGESETPPPPVVDESPADDLAGESETRPQPVVHDSPADDLAGESETPPPPVVHGSPGDDLAGESKVLSETGRDADPGADSTGDPADGGATAVAGYAATEDGHSQDGEAASVLEDQQTQPPVFAVAEGESDTDVATPTEPPSTISEVVAFEGADEPPPPRPRMSTGAVVAIVIGVIAAVVVAFQVVDTGDGDTGGEAGEGGAEATVVQDTAAVDDTAPELQVIDTTEIVSTRTASPIVVDGDLAEWTFVDTAYEIRHEIFRQSGVTALGEPGPGTAFVAHDDASLYVGVFVDDDVYSQANVGNQIWRGDAVTINLSTGSAGDTITASDFQLTMTPRSAAGVPEAVLFTGGGSGSFGPNTTQVSTTIAGVISADGRWTFEATIPWSVFGLSGPPSAELTALFNVFDNDGEVLSDSRPAQTLILANVPGAGFQVPSTWGSLDATS